MIRRCWMFAAFVAAGCGGDAPPPTAGTRAKPRQDDPKLTQTWTMPKDKSPIASADLGTTPEDAALGLMKSGIPGAAHKAADACRESGALKGAASVALRFDVDGGLHKIEGDPSGAAATCVAEAFEKEVGALKDLPAAHALLRIKFHPAQ